MPDFRKIVEERIAPLHLKASAENLIEEVTLHLEERYRELRSGGVPEEEAYRETVAELDDMYPIEAELSGNPARQEAAPPGDASKGNLGVDLWRDLRYAPRMLRHNPVFVVFVVVTLALGIGANTTVFTFINTLVLNPLPVYKPAELVAVATAEMKSTAKSAAALPISYPNLKDYRTKNEVFSSLAGYTSPHIVTLQTNSGSERMFSELVTGDYFTALGLRPAKGRFFSPDEDSAGGALAVAVMNYATWQGRFGGTDDVIGKTLRLNGIVFSVIGVAPPRFIGVNAIFGPDLWIPSAMSERLLPGEMQNALEDRSKAVFLGVARLRPGVSRAQATADIATIASGLARAYPDANAGRTATARPIADVIFSADSSNTGPPPVLFASAVLLLVVGIVLLIACSNVTNLLLARSAARQQEIAVRLAMGASRSRLMRQLLTESVLLGLLSGIAGLLVGYAGQQLLNSLRPAEVGANMVAPHMDGNVLAFTLIVSLVTGFIFGTVPAWRASRVSVAEALKEETHTAGRSRRRITFANALLVGQVAFSFISLVTAALFLRSIQRAYEIDPGFQTQHLAVFLTNPGQAGYGKAQTKAFYKDVRERVTALPGVESASWASSLPLWGRVASGLEIEGREPRSKADTITTVVNTVDLDYFKTASIGLVRGRDFSRMDGDNSTAVAIVNEKLAHDYWPGANGIGKHVQLPGEKIRREVIGVVKTANYSALGEPPQPCVYMPLEQDFSDAMVLYVRSKAEPQQILTAVQREMRLAGPEVLVNDVRTGSTIVDQALFGARLGVALLSVFGLLALGLASVGLYGVVAYSVTLRKKEIGVRMALGAAQSSVLRLVLKQGMSLVLTGVLIGFAAAMAVMRLLTRALYGVGPSDPVSVVGAAGVLLAIALVACYLPARSASRLDPLVALREG